LRINAGRSGMCGADLIKGLPTIIPSLTPGAQTRPDPSPVKTRSISSKC
jgi:hypothetical protein